MSGSMDELDNRILLLKWRSGKRERRRKFVYFILEKSCSQHYRCRKTWLRRNVLILGKFLEGRAMSRKKNSEEEL